MCENIEKSEYSEDHIQIITGDMEHISNDENVGYQSTFLLPENTKINSREIIVRYGKMLEELCKTGIDGRPVTLKELAQLCDITEEGVRKIIKGLPQSIKVEYCNKFAKFFNCSAYYLLGLAEDKQGVIIDKKEFSVPFKRIHPQYFPYVFQALEWFERDPELFLTLEKVFHLDVTKREAIRVILSSMTR